MKEWFIRLTLLAFGFSVAVVAVEFGLNRFAPQVIIYPQGITEPDNTLGWKGVPHAETIIKRGGMSIPVKKNAHGFRDKERTYEKGKDIFRILVLGDSFTEAPQVPIEETFTYLLEQKLNSESGKRYEVLNLGISGFGTDQEYLMLRYYGLQYDPDVVILALYIGNDITDNSVSFDPRYPKPQFVLNNGTLEERPFKINDGTEGTPFRSVKDHFRKLLPQIYYLLAGRIDSTPGLKSFLRKIGFMNPEPLSREQPKESKPAVQEIPRYWYDVYAQQYSPQLQDAWEVTEALLLEAQHALKVKKIGFLVLVIPMELEFRPAGWDKTPFRDPKMRAVKFDVRKPERLLANFLEANHIESLFLRPGFEEYTNDTGKDLYLQDANEIHWNDNGHRFASEVLYEKLVDDKVVHERL